MGLTKLKLEVANPANPDVVETVEFLIDSGALYPLVPRPILQGLGSILSGRRPSAWRTGSPSKGK